LLFIALSKSPTSLRLLLSCPILKLLKTTLLQLLLACPKKYFTTVITIPNCLTFFEPLNFNAQLENWKWKSTKPMVILNLNRNYQFLPGGCSNFCNFIWQQFNSIKLQGFLLFFTGGVTVQMFSNVFKWPHGKLIKKKTRAS